jgi:hypothetical protein
VFQVVVCVVSAVRRVTRRGVGSVNFFKAVVRLANCLQKVHTAYTTASHNHSQHNQAFSHEDLTRIVLIILMVGIMMPETC